MASSLVATRSLLLPHQSSSSTRRNGGHIVVCSCSSMEDFTRKAGKLAFATVAATVLLAGAADARPRPRFGSSDEEIREYLDKTPSYDDQMMRAYLDVKGKWTGTKCPSPVTSGATDGFKLEPGDYYVTNMCLQPTSYQVTRKAGIGEFDISTTYETKLLARVDGIEGSLAVAPDGGVKFEEKKGLNTDTTIAKVIARLPGKQELVPFMFGIQDLVASGRPESFGGQFIVPTATIQPKKLDVDETEPLESTTTEGSIVFKVTRSNLEAKELGGEFETSQLSGLDLRSRSNAGFLIGNKEKKRVKVSGVWYAKLD
ncbi:oxygen-evolving enhancer protein 1, chloroplastic-like [Selaginella moellendorffii]|uniref:oxygen-evolving enhancer protein 1, chloroplastic-like n=1 Tax=Selaginella moellendorffii TaxID=88036 RepID=UPI000D1C59B5|nr:oxygen-evolving enhancer protein 1, chloroplastic-like [Selaginella moellendorffii]|eukprot:XP_024522430.1 oxygen-evolving enhancer protein 1, chloroplastic-like [Selaginella moellendorffii]